VAVRAQHNGGAAEISMNTQMNRQKLYWALGISFAVIAILCCVAGALLLHLFTGINNDGSMELAQEWKKELQRFVSLEEAKVKMPEIQGAKFENGEWVIGLCRDSHGNLRPGGGTMVLKDSRGKTRLFFGHVCGQNYLDMMVTKRKSLDDFYNNMAPAMNEYEWPAD
jgi:hypothetical protein